ncbi:MAG: hypothetical protein R2766_02880 [Saprospiraceae bacterium]
MEYRSDYSKYQCKSQVQRTYSVTVTNADGCEASTSATVNVNPLPNPTISGDLEICDGETTTLTASGGTSYVWNTGATTASINVSPNTTTTYSVTVTNADGCEASTSATVIVNPLPEITITGDTEICEGDCTKLTAESENGVIYEWSEVSEIPCQGSYYVGEQQDETIQKLYYYDGNLEYIGTLTAPNVNGIGYYCGSGADRAIYGMQRPGEDPINAVRANLVKINVETGVTEVLGEISQPMNIYGPTGVTGIFNYIADVTEDGHYLFPAMTALINPTNLKIIDYTVYLEI